MKFGICAEFLDAKLLVFTLPKTSRANINATISSYGSFANSNPQTFVNTSCTRNNALQNSVFYQTALCTFARAIIDAETLRSLFVNISCIFGISRRTPCILFSKMHTDERNQSAGTLSHFAE